MKSRPPSALHRAFAGRVSACAIAALLCACGGSPAPPLGVRDGRLTQCPETPNCVCSDSTDAEHRIEPFRLAAAGPASRQALQAALAGMPRARVTDSRADYLRIEFSSAVLGFVDDVELQLRPAQGSIAVRSAARVGYSDLGVNRRRVETMRQLLQQRGVLK